MRSIHAGSRLSSLAANKIGDSRFYDWVTAIADRLYDEHLETLRNEGLI